MPSDTSCLLYEGLVPPGIRYSTTCRWEVDAHTVDSLPSINLDSLTTLRSLATAMTEADADICSHVIAERRTSSTNAPIESFGVLPPLVRRSSASSEAPRTCRRHSTGCRQRPYGFIPGQPNRGPPLANSSKHASGSSPHLQPIPQAAPPPIQDEAMTKEDEDDVDCTSRQYRIRENTPIPISTPTSNRASGASDQTAYLSEGGQDTHDFSEKSDRWSKDLEANGGERYRTWSLWASESVATNALVPALVTQALATG